MDNQPEVKRCDCATCALSKDAINGWFMYLMRMPPRATDCPEAEKL